MRRYLPDKELDWLNTAQSNILSASIKDDKTIELYLQYSAMARRKLCNAAVITLCDSDWYIHEIGRILLLMQLLNCYTSENHVTLLKSIYNLVDENEKQVIAKGMVLLDREGVAVNLAISIGRTNNINLFSSMALNNKYPAINYDSRAFNQLVLKALFMDLDIAQLTGLQKRLSPELTRLCIDLVKERLVADRSPPDSVWLAINPVDLSSDDQYLYQKNINKIKQANNVLGVR